MAYKFIILTILGVSTSILAQESAASPGQIAYAISQNYDQTGPGLVQQGATTQNTPSTYQQTLSSLQQTQPQIFTQQQQYVQQPQQYTQQYVQPQQYVQQNVPMNLYHQQNAQSLFGRFQASHTQPQVSYTHVQVQPTQQQAQQPTYLTYTQPQVRYVQAQHTQQTKAVPQYTYDVQNSIANDAAKGRPNEAIFGFNHFAQTNSQHGGFTPIVIQPKAQESSYVVPEGKSTYTSPVVVRAVYQQATKPVLGAQLAKFSAPVQHQYRFAQ